MKPILFTKFLAFLVLFATTSVNLRDDVIGVDPVPLVEALVRQQVTNVIFLESVSCTVGIPNGKGAGYLLPLFAFRYLHRHKDKNLVKVDTNDVSLSFMPE